MLKPLKVQDLFEMTSPILVVTTIVRKTKAEMFANVKVGHKLQCSIKLEATGRGYSGPRSAYVKTTNLDTGEHTYDTFNQLSNMLECFEFEEYVGL